MEYLGWSGKVRLRARRWDAYDCQLLAQSAQAILDLKHQLHEVTAEAVCRMLPPDTPRFHRMLCKKIVAKLPLAPDAKLAALGRGFQLVGIYMCIVTDRPLDRCACLTMFGWAVMKEQVKRHVEELLGATSHDLQGEVAHRSS